MEWRTVVRTVLVVLVCGALLLSVGGALAQEPADRDVNGTGQVGTAAPGPAVTPPKGLSPVDLKVLVDEAYCATGGTQCVTVGEGALPGNRNPVRLGIQVVARGMSPLATMPSEAFNVWNPFVPAGGAGVERHECTDCFQNGGFGVYSIFVIPPEEYVWKSGSYFVQVQVTIGIVTFFELVEVEIPFVPAS